jgi:hypothetical protein
MGFHANFFRRKRTVKKATSVHTISPYDGLRSGLRSNIPNVIVKIFEAPPKSSPSGRTYTPNSPLKGEQEGASFNY